MARSRGLGDVYKRQEIMDRDRYPIRHLHLRARPSQLQVVLVLHVQIMLLLDGVMEQRRISQGTHTLLDQLLRQLPLFPTGHLDTTLHIQQVMDLVWRQLMPLDVLPVQLLRLPLLLA
jgi:hypothetical protein